MASMPSSLSLPCLAIHRDLGRSTTTVLLSVPEKKVVATGADVDGVIAPALANKTILPTARGYLLVRDPASLATFLYSPQSRRKIDLPPLAIDQDLLRHGAHCLLSDEPTDPSCVVLLVEPDATFVWHLRLGGDGDQTRWQRHEYDIGSQVYDEDDEKHPAWIGKTVIRQTAACRGKFYFNPTSTELGVVDFSAGLPAFGSTPAGCPDEGEYAVVGRVFLVESQGELYMVNLLMDEADMNTCTGLSVYVMDLERTRWRMVGDLGGRTFLMSPVYVGASCESGRLRGDCVYVVRPMSRELHVFDVRDGSMETHKLHEAPFSNKGFWVLPTSF
ncbi:hypothetical protein ZWY2020_058072 [Hordeum vulgare]|nr:hypothetical protein ZWY2020_058072 [Hordeum vulgare]